MFHYLIFFFVLSHVSDVSANDGVPGSLNFYFNNDSTNGSTIDDILADGGVISPDNSSGHNYHINIDYSNFDYDVTNNQQTEFNNSSISSSEGGSVTLGSLSNRTGPSSDGTGVFTSSKSGAWFTSS